MLKFNILLSLDNKNLDYDSDPWLGHNTMPLFPSVPMMSCCLDQCRWPPLCLVVPWDGHSNHICVHVVGDMLTCLHLFSKCVGCLGRSVLALWADPTVGGASDCPSSSIHWSDFWRFGWLVLLRWLCDYLAPRIAIDIVWFLRMFWVAALPGCLWH